MSSAMVTASPHCKDAAGFSAEFKNQLGNKGLQDLFDNSPDTLGQGNFGIVKSIPWILESGEQIKVAVKKVKLGTKSDVKQVDNEIDNLVQLKGNEYILQIFGCMEMITQVQSYGFFDGKFKKGNKDQTVVFIVLEKLFGDFEDSTRPSSPFMKFKDLSVVQKMELSLQLAEGLKSMHDKGLVHADLKPANMMAADENLSKVKIIDLGLGANIGSRFITSTTLYMDLDAWNTGVIKTTFDTHSFGLTIAGMEYGTNSFRDNIMPLFRDDNEKFGIERRANVKQLFNKASGWGNDPESIIHDSFTKILMNCIEIDASKRPSDEDLIKRLKDVIEETKRITNIRDSKRGSLLVGSQKIVYPKGIVEVVKPTSTIQVVKPSSTIQVVKPIATAEIVKTKGNIEVVKPTSNIGVVKPITTAQIVKTKGIIEVVKPTSNIGVVKPITTAEIVKTKGIIEAVKPITTAQIVKTKGTVEVAKPKETVEVVKPKGNVEVDKPTVIVEVVNAVQKSLTASKQPTKNPKGSSNILKTLNTKIVTDTGIEENKRSPFIYILIGVVLLGLLVPVGYFLCFKRQPELVGSA